MNSHKSKILKENLLIKLSSNSARSRVYFAIEFSINIFYIFNKFLSINIKSS